MKSEHEFLNTSLFNFENELKLLKEKVTEKERESSLFQQKFKAEFLVKEKEWLQSNSERDEELNELKQKFEELITIYKKNKEELEEMNVKLKKNKDVIKNYKELIDTLTNTKEKALNELERSDNKIYNLMKTTNVTQLIIHRTKIKR